LCAFARASNSTRDCAELTCFIEVLPDTANPVTILMRAIARRAIARIRSGTTVGWGVEAAILIAKVE
jgi:hypothetical protein